MHTQRSVVAIGAVVALSLMGLPGRSRAARTVESPVVWKTVADQHGSTIALPLSLLRQVSDPVGRSFETKDGRVSIHLWTTTEPRPDFPGHNPKDDMGLGKSDCDVWPPPYLRVSEQVAAYSCVLHGKVSYYEARYSPWGSVALMVRYPVTAKAEWDGYVSRMARSLKQVQRRELR